MRDPRNFSRAEGKYEEKTRGAEGRPACGQGPQSPGRGRPKTANAQSSGGKYRTGSRWGDRAAWSRGLPNGTGGAY